MDYKRLSIILSIALVFTIGLSAFLAFEAYADKPITVIVNGKKINFPDAQPQFVDGRIMIPVRFVSEALGARVDRDAKTNTVYITSAPPAQCEPVQSPEQPEKPQQKQAAVGEIIEFSNSKVKVNGVSYNERYKEFSAGDGRYFAIVNMDVYTNATPQNKIDWTALDFVDALILADGRVISGSIGTKDLVEKDKWVNVDVMLSINKNDTLSGVIVVDTVNKDEKATVKF